MNLRKLNDDGIRVFSEYLVALKRGETPDYPEHILTDELHSEPVGSTPVTISQNNFATKLELAGEIDRILKKADIQSPQEEPGLLTWLALFYFDFIHGRDRSGRMKMDREWHYVFDGGNFQTYYRHKIFAPYNFYKLCEDSPEDALVVLGVAPNIHGDMMEQVASRQELFTNVNIIRLLTRLYWDPEKQELKKGAASRAKQGTKRGGGSVGRIATLLQQFRMTYDLHLVGTEELYDLLPDEYDRFKNKNLRQRILKLFQAP